MHNIAEKNKLTQVHPFPSIDWWQKTIRMQTIHLDGDSFYNKSQPQNRYYLTGSQGMQLMSIPIKGGRNQRSKIKDIMISYDVDWQSHHLKTLKTLYERAPFFEFYGPEIESLFQEKTTHLFEWNKKSIHLIMRLLKMNLEIGKDITDANEEIVKHQIYITKEVRYHQVFEGKINFQPNCSILDLLFCEGRNALILLNN